MLMYVKFVNQFTYFGSKIFFTVVTWKKVTEWEIIKTEARNKMEVFITLTEYNTHPPREEGKLLVM